MAIPSRQIGWSTEDNLLWQISKQLEQLTNVTAKTCTNCTTTTTTTAAPAYRVFMALLTQNGEDNTQEKVSGDTLELGVTYFISVNSEDADLTIFGAPNNNAGTSFICTNSGVLDPFKPLSLLYDTGAPVATVLENTIGNIWFTYNNLGIYGVNSNSLYIQDKTYIIMGSNSGRAGDGYCGFNTIIDTNEIIRIFTTYVSRDQFENDILTNTVLEIRVYN
jgi:hypothetical protein